MRDCNCSMFCCISLYVNSIFAIMLMGKRELVALHSLSSWCLVMVVWPFLTVPWVCLLFVIVVFPDHTHLLFLANVNARKRMFLFSYCIVRKLPHKLNNVYVFVCIFAFARLDIYWSVIFVVFPGHSYFMFYVFAMQYNPSPATKNI